MASATTEPKLRRKTSEGDKDSEPKLRRKPSEGGDKEKPAVAASKDDKEKEKELLATAPNKWASWNKRFWTTWAMLAGTVSRSDTGPCCSLHVC